MRQQRFAASRGADEQDVRLGQLHFVRTHLVHLDALVVVVNSHGELLLRLVLADHEIVEEALDLGRLGEMTGSGGGSFAAAVVFKNGVADGNALVADVGAGIVAGRRDQFGYSILRLVAERTA